jgi:hypothetical protein
MRVFGIVVLQVLVGRLMLVFPAFCFVAGGLGLLDY